MKLIEFYSNSSFKYLFASFFLFFELPEDSAIEKVFLYLGIFWRLIGILLFITGLFLGGNIILCMLFVGFSFVFYGIYAIIIEIRASRDAILQKIEKPIIIVVTNNNNDDNNQYENIYMN